MKPSARSNAPFGYKALIIHADGHSQVLARQGRIAGRNFPTREEAVEYAIKRIATLEDFKAINKYRFENRDVHGRRPTDAQARTALGIKRGDVP